MRHEQLASDDWTRGLPVGPLPLEGAPANQNATGPRPARRWSSGQGGGATRPAVRLEEVSPEDEARVRATFWEKLTEARPHFGRLSGLRDFAVNLVRLFEMLVEPDFAVPWRTTAAIVFALAYFVSSVDLIPDAIPFFGFVDDALVVAEVVVMVGADLARFEETRRARRAKAARAA